MSSSSDALLRSIRRWAVVVGLLLGLGVVALAAIGYLATGAREGLLFAVVGVSGGVVALFAVLALLWGLATGPAGSVEQSRDVD